MFAMEDADAKEKRAIRRFHSSTPGAGEYDHGRNVARQWRRRRDVSSMEFAFIATAALERNSAIEFTVTLPGEVTMTEPIR